MRDFGETFSTLGLNPAYAGAAYGLAEHVVGVCVHETNPSGLPLSTLSDEDLQCVGELRRLPEGLQVHTACLQTKYSDCRPLQA